MSSSSAHPDASQLVDYRAGRLPPSEVLAVSDHLAGCPACRAALPVIPGRWDDGLPPLLPDAPPDYEEMAALLDGSLDDAQSAATHTLLATSPEAGAAFASLRHFRDEIAALPPKWHGPRNPPEAARKVVPFPNPHRTVWLAAAAMVLLSAVWWLATNIQPAKNESLWADADLSRLPGDLRLRVEHAAQTGTLDAPPPQAELRPPRGVLAGSPPEPTSLRLLAPVGVVIREDHPALRWTPVPAATGYVVYLSDLDGLAPTLRQEVPAGVTAWTSPSALMRGTTFEWQVEALRGSEILARSPRPPEPEARFQVLDARHAAELTEVEGLYPQNALILGTAYAQAGLAGAAEQQFETLARRYPRSDAAKRLRRQTMGGVTVGE